MNSPNDEPWIVRPEGIRILWRVLWAVLVITVLLEFVIKIKGYFGIDDWVGFGAAYGFFSCVAMVVVAKGLGIFLKRDEKFYRGEGDNND